MRWRFFLFFILHILLVAILDEAGKLHTAIIINVINVLYAQQAPGRYPGWGIAGAGEQPGQGNSWGG